MSSRTINGTVDLVVEHYLKSHDFNGLPFDRVCPTKTLEDAQRELLKELIRSGRITFRASDHGNPFVKRLPDVPTEVDIKIATEIPLHCVVLYPTVSEMLERKLSDKYVGKPFTLMLAQGMAQLDYCCFDLSVLEFYRNDPRYQFKVSDVFGHIYAGDNEPNMRASDEVFLQTFGFAYDEQFNRAVAVYLRYLNDFTPEHQQIWASKLLPKDGFQIHPDYWRSSIRGMWSDHMPILDALILEFGHIRKLSQLCGPAPIFRDEYDWQRKPKKLMFLLRPTKQEFLSFVHVLDKILSENINKDFFRGDIPLTEEVPLGEGKVEIRHIGTLRLLEEWIKKHFTVEDSAPLESMIKAFRRVRALRQKPAHTISDDKFDQSYFKEQRKLIIEVYTAVRDLRLLFQNVPGAEGHEIEDSLKRGKIRTY